MKRRSERDAVNFLRAGLISVPGYSPSGRSAAAPLHMSALA